MKEAYVSRDDLSDAAAIRCVGRVLAGLEADALPGAIVAHIERFEPAGEPEPWMTTIGHGPEKLPVRLFAV